MKTYDTRRDYGERSNNGNENCHCSFSNFHFSIQYFRYTTDSLNVSICNKITPRFSSSVFSQNKNKNFNNKKTTYITSTLFCPGISLEITENSNLQIAKFTIVPGSKLALLSARSINFCNKIFVNKRRSGR